MSCLCCHAGQPWEDLPLQWALQLHYKKMGKFSTNSEVKSLSEVLTTAGLVADDQAVFSGDLIRIVWFSETEVCLNFTQQSNAFLPEPHIINAIEIYF